MLFLNSLKGLRLYYWLPLIPWASTFSNYWLLDPMYTWSSLGQYFIYFLSLMCHRYIFSGQSHHCYLSRHSSIKNLPSLSIKSTLSCCSVRCYLCIYLAFLYLRSSNAQYILIEYFLYFIFSALYILHLLFIYIIYANI